MDSLVGPEQQHIQPYLYNTDICIMQTPGSVPLLFILIRFHCIEKQIVPCKSNAEEVSFEWSHYRILSTDSQVRTTLHVSILDSGSERVNGWKHRKVSDSVKPPMANHPRNQKKCLLKSGVSLWEIKNVVFVCSWDHDLCPENYAGKYCLKSTSYLTELFVVFILLHVSQNFVCFGELV